MTLKRIISERIWQCHNALGVNLGLYGVWLYELSSSVSCGTNTNIKQEIHIETTCLPCLYSSSSGGFPESSVGKEFVCNAWDPGLIPALGRSPGEGIGYPFLCSQASLVAQLVKNLPAMRETWVWSLGSGDPLEKGKDIHSSILAWRIPWTVQSMGLQRVRCDWVTFTDIYLLNKTQRVLTVKEV